MGGGATNSLPYRKRGEQGGTGEQGILAAGLRVPPGLDSEGTPGGTVRTTPSLGRWHFRRDQGSPGPSKRDSASSARRGQEARSVVSLPASARRRRTALSLGQPAARRTPAEGSARSLMASLRLLKGPQEAPVLPRNALGHRKRTATAAFTRSVRLWIGTGRVRNGGKPPD